MKTSRRTLFRCLFFFTIAICVCKPAVLQAQTYGVIFSFHGTDGANPWGPLVRDSAGSIWGTAESGGTACTQDGDGCGTVFAITATGKGKFLSKLLPPAGQFPFGGLISNGAGFLGTSSAGGDFGAGNIFKVGSDGSVVNLHSFNFGTEGTTPLGQLVSDGAGNYYGTNSGSGDGNNGTIFKMDSSGNVTVLYAFQRGADGGGPSSGLARDASGNLYGTAFDGGDLSGCGSGLGCGTVFELTSAGEFKVLHTFEGGQLDGAFPSAGVTLGSNGNLYGVTREGGSSQCSDEGAHGCGVVFKISKAGKYTVLHRFSGSGDGADPETNVVLDASGTIYGVTARRGIRNTTACGPLGCGTLFSLTGAGAFITLHQFTGLPDGSTPHGLSLLGGILYGSTSAGGANGQGAIFRFLL